MLYVVVPTRTQPPGNRQHWTSSIAEYQGGEGGEWGVSFKTYFKFLIHPTKKEKENKPKVPYIMIRVAQYYLNFDFLFRDFILKRLWEFKIFWLNNSKAKMVKNMQLVGGICFFISFPPHNSQLLTLMTLCTLSKLSLILCFKLNYASCKYWLKWCKMPIYDVALTLTIFQHFLQKLIKSFRLNILLRWKIWYLQLIGIN